MATFQDVGVICFNGEIPDECRGCLWWENEALTGPPRCGNRHSAVCALFLQELLAPAPLAFEAE